MKKITIASGKGGTGKTTFSVNLALASGASTLLLDCDVEEPNCHLFWGGHGHKLEDVFLPVPRVIIERCTGCGECVTACQFNAIVTVKRKAMIFSELCHSCGLCQVICQDNAIEEDEKRVGEVRQVVADERSLFYGVLEVASPMAPPIIRAVKQVGARSDAEFLIIDAPPGTSCAAVATVRDSDFVLLVTEPTPFGLHDLMLAVDMVREIGTPFAVALNRSDSGDDRVQHYCKAENIPIFLELPERRDIAYAYSRGEPLVEAIPELKEVFSGLLDRIKNQIQTIEGVH